MVAVSDWSSSSYGPEGASRREHRPRTNRSRGVAEGGAIHSISSQVSRDVSCVRALIRPGPSLNVGTGSVPALTRVRYRAVDGTETLHARCKNLAPASRAKSGRKRKCIASEVAREKPLA